MNKTGLVKWLIGLTVLTCLGSIIFPIKSLRYPLPTGGISLEEDKESRRQQWIEQMHRAAPGTNWKEIEYRTRYSRHLTNRLQSAGRSACTTPATFPDAQLSGKWIERGSNNQTGSSYETAYDAQQDRIWLISAGGTLWSSPRLEPEWKMENQDLQFDRGFLEFVPTIPGKKRLLAFSNQLPHFSDDFGQSWQQASGIPVEGDFPAFHSPVLASNNSIFVLSKPDYYDVFGIYRSKDRGESFQKIALLDMYEADYFSLCRPSHSDALFLARKTADQRLRLQLWDKDQEAFKDVASESPVQLGRAPANLIGSADSLGQLQLFTYAEKEKKYFLYKSINEGKSWEEVGQLPEIPWEVGLFLSPSHSNVLYLGEIEAFRSTDGGKHWEKVNEWWEYYENIEGALHADIMAFGEYQSPDGEIFTLISHHGGISLSYDQFDTQTNIGISHLNTSQYYCVRTDPHDPNVVYAGSQDQGFQRAVSFEEHPRRTQPFEQLISGDYGPIVFTREGTALWTVYPEGWVNYYDDPQQGFVDANFELNSENESVWLPPLMPDPRPEKNAIFMAGGNLNGGPGSYLIRLEYINKKIQTSQIDFDFKAESAGGELSAMAASPTDPDTWYTATTNGRFFYTHDRGKNWEQSLNFIPDGHYLYGQAILVSNSDPRKVWLAGSGYNNPPVYLSVDGGKSFQSMDEGLPPTLVLGLAANTDESLLFAATEAGPFVFRAADAQWYALSSPCLPAQTFWSVEYIDAIKTLRFGTYGRGIWDFQLEINTPAVELPVSREQIKVYPNPGKGPIYISLEDLYQDVHIVMRSASGRIIHRWDFPEAGHQITVPTDQLPDGIYFISFQTGDQVHTRKVILQH